MTTQKRTRADLEDANAHDSQLAEFIEQTQPVKRRLPSRKATRSLKHVSNGVSFLTVTSQEQCQTYGGTSTDKCQYMGLSKRRLIDQFEALCIEKVPKEESKPKLIQVLKSEKFDDQSSDSLTESSLAQIEHLTTGNSGYVSSDKEMSDFGNGSDLPCLKLQIADKQMEQSIKDYTRRNLQASSTRSRSWDGRIMGAQETDSKIELHSKVQKTNQELLVHFFKYYLCQIMKKNATLNHTYIESLKSEYQKLQKGHKIRFHELRQSLDKINQDFEMSEEYTVDPEAKRQAKGLISNFLSENTNYYDLLGTSRSDQDNVTQNTQIFNKGKEPDDDLVMHQELFESPQSMRQSIQGMALSEDYMELS